MTSVAIMTESKSMVGGSGVWFDMSDLGNEKPDENEVLKRMLNTPPKPHEFGDKKKGAPQEDAPKPSQVKPG